MSFEAVNSFKGKVVELYICMYVYICTDMYLVLFFFFKIFRQWDGLKNLHFLEFPGYTDTTGLGNKL